MTAVDLERYDNFLFDCDGVMWCGQRAIPGSFETLNQLQQRGKRVFFVTNSASSTQKGLAKKLTRRGYMCTSDQVYGSALATAVYLRKRYPSIHKVFLIGQEAFQRELESQGLTVIHSSDFPQGQVKDWADLKTIQPDSDIGAVVLGSQLSFTYHAACYASICVQKGAKLVASSHDPYFEVEGGVRMMGAGAFVTYIETATGQMAEVVGKPSPFYMEWAQERDHLDPRRTLMIGDMVDSDIQFAHNAGIDSALVLTGVTKEADLADLTLKPTYVLADVAALLKTS